jgi:hypothetical protein
MRIPIQQLKLMRIHADPDTDPGRNPGLYYGSVLQIRDVYLDPNFFHPGSRNQGQKDSVSRDPGSLSTSKYLCILTLSSRKYDPGCSSRIWKPDSDFLHIPDPWVKKAPDPGSLTLLGVT